MLSKLSVPCYEHSILVETQYVDKADYMKVFYTIASQYMSGRIPHGESTAWYVFSCFLTRLDGDTDTIEWTFVLAGDPLHYYGVGADKHVTFYADWVAGCLLIFNAENMSDLLEAYGSENTSNIN